MMAANELGLLISWPENSEMTLGYPGKPEVMIKVELEAEVG